MLHLTQDGGVFRSDRRDREHFGCAAERGHLRLAGEINAEHLQEMGTRPGGAGHGAERERPMDWWCCDHG